MHTRPWILAFVLTTGCGPDLVLPSPALPVEPQVAAPLPEPEAPPPVAEPAPEANPPILVGAGDIANCHGSSGARAEATAQLLDRIFAEGREGLVFTAGDNAYRDGSEEEFRGCYGRSWGRHKARTRPAVGNHEYRTPGAAPYYAYFGAAAGEPGKGWYSYDLGGWHVVVLNSNCAKVEGGCREGSPQEQWLRSDLAAQSGRCTLAIWHHPRFSSGVYGDDPITAPLWRVLDDFDVELLLTGHEHHYERFAPMDADGNPTPDGLRQFIVGTGGVAPRRAKLRRPHSELLQTGATGVLMLTLRPDALDWEFVPIDGVRFSDSGTLTCR